MLGGRYSYLSRWEMRTRQSKAILHSEFKASQCNETQSQKQCSRKQNNIAALAPRWIQLVGPGEGWGMGSRGVKSPNVCAGDLLYL